ncbi:MAG: chemotaxis protein [Butyrivibrio sp.]
MDTNILLENGTNELEVLEFMVGNNHYGINVAKVREILTYQPITPVPNSHKFVEGVFMPRDTMISVVDLSKVIDTPPSQDPKNDFLIVTNFNQLNVAFHVHKVLGIHRVSWSDIITPDSTINSSEYGISTGVIKVNDILVVILDFERIVCNISPDTGLKVHEVDRLSSRERNTIPIFIAEDSALLIRLIKDSLDKAGYTNLDLSMNGKECWDKLCVLKQQYKDKVTEHVKCVITDIEMPLMDGHHLTKLIKEDPVLKTVPVAIFSSLITPEMKRKGEALGADIQMSKPEIGLLVDELDKLLL